MLIIESAATLVTRLHSFYMPYPRAVQGWGCVAWRLAHWGGNRTRRIPGRSKGSLHVWRYDRPARLPRSGRSHTIKVAALVIPLSSNITAFSYCFCFHYDLTLLLSVIVFAPTVVWHYGFQFVSALSLFVYLSLPKFLRTLSKFST